MAWIDDRDWDQVESLTCADCDWVGTPAEASMTVYGEVMGVDCPECDRRIYSVGRISTSIRPQTASPTSALPDEADHEALFREAMARREGRQASFNESPARSTAEPGSDPVADFASDADGTRHAILRADLSRLSSCVALVWGNDDDIHDLPPRHTRTFSRLVAWGSPPDFLGFGSEHGVWAIVVDHGERAFLDISDSLDLVAGLDNLDEGAIRIRNGRRLLAI